MSAILLSAVCLTRNAHAEPRLRSKPDPEESGRARAWGPPTVRVRIVGDEGQRLSVSLTRLDEDVAVRVSRCTTPCEMDVPRGPYRLSFPATDESLAGTRDRIVLDEDGKLVVTPRKPVTRTLGLMFGIAGPAMVAGGLVAYFEGWPRKCGESTYCGGSEGVMAFGLALLVSGAVLTPMGWVMFAVSNSPTVTRNPKPMRTAASVGVVPLRGGAAIGGTFLF